MEPEFGAHLFRRFIGSTLMGLTAAYLMAADLNFGRQARTGQGVVLESFIGRGGQTVAQVSHVVDGHAVRATLRESYYPLREGERIEVAYLPGSPGEVVSGWFWRRHLAAIAALGAFGLVAAVERVGFLNWRRRQSVPMLRDEYAGPRRSVSISPSLRIDTSPLLWDRELDG